MKKFTKSALAGALSLAMAFTFAPSFVSPMASVVSSEKEEGNPSKAISIDFKAGEMPEGF